MIRPPRYLDAVYDESNPKKHVIYHTEIADGVIVVRTSEDTPPAWTGQWPGRIPEDAPGLSESAIRKINALLDNV